MFFLFFIKTSLYFQRYIYIYILVIFKLYTTLVIMISAPLATGEVCVIVQPFRKELLGIVLNLT